MSVNEVKSLKYNLIGGGLPISCKVLDGKIIPALSEGELDSTCPSDVWHAMFMRNMGRFYVFHDYESFTAIEGSGQPFSRMAADLATIPFAVEYKIGAMSASMCIYNAKAIFYDNTGRYYHDYPHNVGGGVYKNGRVFAIDLANYCRICWTGEGGVDDWEEKIDGAGWLYLDVELGNIYRLYVLDGQIVALRKYGISLISAYGTPEDFKEVMSVPTLPPYKECATVCGKKLYFYTNGGLHTFTAAGVEKVDLKLAEDFTSPIYSMTYGDSVFFLGTHKKLEKRVILVYNTKDKSSYFIDIPATALCAGAEPYAFTSEGMIKLTKGLSFKYESEEFAHFSKRKKTLKSIFVDSEKGVDVTVQTDGGSRLFKGVKGELKTHMCGRFFKVGVEGTDGEIRQLTATVEYY